jgi:hypothetical protein
MEPTVAWAESAGRHHPDQGGPARSHSMRAFEDEQQRAIGLLQSFSAAPNMVVLDRRMAPPLRRGEAAAAPGKHSRAARMLPSGLLLAGILVVQAMLSVRLLHADTASGDEALYHWAGSLEWSHWLHGTPIPAFAAYFSGSPAIYPPLDAVAYHFGGLTGARVLSLVFMLTATCLLWSTASRLFGQRAAFFTTGMWAILGPTLYLGAYATYDAFSLMLIAVAAWAVVHADERARWLVIASAALALSNAAKYASMIFDPVVVVLAALVVLQHGRKVAARRAAAIVAYTVSLIVLLYALAGASGGEYATGIAQTTFARAGNGNSVLSVLTESWQLIGVVLVVALVAILVALFDRASFLLVAALAGAGLLVPLEQARIHTLTSLNKHVDFGAWFAAIAVGYGAHRLLSIVRPWGLRAAAGAACAVLLVLPARAGFAQARAITTGWANSAKFISAFVPLVKSTPGPLLTDSPSLSESVLATGTDWERWSNTRSLRLPDGRSISVPVAESGLPGTYAPFIAAGYFKLVALNYQLPVDWSITRYLDQNPAYRLVASVPYGSFTFRIWKYEPSWSGQ